MPFRHWLELECECFCQSEDWELTDASVCPTCKALWDTLLGDGCFGLREPLPWEWQFLVSCTCVCHLDYILTQIAVFILPDLPTNSKGFTEDELLVARMRMEEDVGEADTDSDQQGAFDGLVMALKDTKIYVLMFTLTAYVVGLSFNAFFVSTVVRYTGWRLIFSLPLPELSVSATFPLFS